MILIMLLYSFSVLQASFATERPIIGILCDESRYHTERGFIAASYVKAVEASGARVVPIFLSRGYRYYKNMVYNVNGVLLPGGEAKETTEGGYFEAARHIYNYARQLHAEGVHFPLLGICLGMQALAEISNKDYTNSNQTLKKCFGVNGRTLPLNMTSDFMNSSLYGNVRPNVLNILKTQSVTANSHLYCVQPDKIMTPPWHILSLNTDGDGKEFISSMEMKGPIVGIQFHPEKNAFEWDEKYPSYEDGLLAARHFFDWLVTEARKNNHSFMDWEEERFSLINKYFTDGTMRVEGDNRQIYIFDRSTSASYRLIPSQLIPVILSFVSLILLENNHGTKD